VRVINALTAPGWLCAFILALAPSLAVADVPFVDGTMWEASTRPEKVSYIVGLSDLLDAEYAFQQKSGNPPSTEQSFVGLLWENIDELSIDECIERIDRWYRNHPSEKDTVVIDVIWTDMVQPNLEQSRDP
jgi:hypothetical protein